MTEETTEITDTEIARRYDWLKLWNDTSGNIKFRMVAKKAGVSCAIVRAVWEEVLIAANRNKDNRGSIHGFSVEYCALELDIEEDQVNAVIEQMQGRLLNGDSVIGWDDRQKEKHDNSATERKRRQREREKQEVEMQELKDLLKKQAELIEALQTQLKANENKGLQNPESIDERGNIEDVTPMSRPCHAMSRHSHGDIEIDKEREEEQKNKSVKDEKDLTNPDGFVFGGGVAKTEIFEPQAQNPPEITEPDPPDLLPVEFKKSRVKPPKKPSDTGPAWEAYSEAYKRRWRVEPTRNAMTNGQMAQFCKRVPLAEAPEIAAWFVDHQNRFYVEKMHSVGLLLKDAETLRAQWQTGSRMTHARAMEADKAASRSLLNPANENAMASGRERELQEEEDRQYRMICAHFEGRPQRPEDIAKGGFGEVIDMQTGARRAAG